MAWRSLGKVALPLSLLLWGCVSPVDLPTERETVPTQTQTPLELIEREVTVEVTSGDDTFRTAAYQVELSTAQIDTGAGERLRARILLRRSEPVVAPVVLDSLELLIARLPGGRRSGAEVLDGLQLDLQERLDHGTVSRSWRWRPGMPMANARIQLVLGAGPLLRRSGACSGGLSCCGMLASPVSLRSAPRCCCAPAADALEKCEMLYFCAAWSLSSAGPERPFHTRKVGGSNPPATTPRRHEGGAPCRSMLCRDTREQHSTHVVRTPANQWRSVRSSSAVSSHRGS